MAPVVTQFSPRPRVTDRPQGTTELLDVVYLVTQLIWSDLRRADQPIELTQWATLRRIGRGPCTMSELARHKGVGLPTMSKSVEMLVRKGWVERWIDKTDRRQTLVRLTASGRRVMADSRARFESLVEEKLASMNPAGRDVLASVMEQVREALSQ
jgi:DNA-binding MarR family transcriptional regulator